MQSLEFLRVESYNRRVNTISDEQKELCAISVMRTMLNDYSVKAERPFDELFYQFVDSATYEALLDYQTGLWAEGPDYLRAVYVDELLRRQGEKNPI